MPFIGRGGSSPPSDTELNPHGLWPRGVLLFLTSADPPWIQQVTPCSRARRGPRSSGISSTSILEAGVHEPDSGAPAGHTRLMDLQKVLRAVACPIAEVVARSMFRLSTTSIRAWKNQTTGGKTQ